MGVREVYCPSPVPVSIFSEGAGCAAQVMRRDEVRGDGIKVGRQKSGATPR